MLSPQYQDSQDLHSILAVGHEDSLECVRTFGMQVTENSAQTWHKLKTLAQGTGQSRVTHMHLRACLPFQGMVPLCLPQLFLTVLVLFPGRFYKWLLKMPPTAAADSLPDTKRGWGPRHSISAPGPGSHWPHLGHVPPYNCAALGVLER